MQVYQMVLIALARKDIVLKDSVMPQISWQESKQRLKGNDRVLT